MPSFKKMVSALTTARQYRSQPKNPLEGRKKLARMRRNRSEVRSCGDGRRGGSKRTCEIKRAS
jgi:hypothetical protein